jgi:hypothetical protein
VRQGGLPDRAPDEFRCHRGSIAWRCVNTRLRSPIDVVHVKRSESEAGVRHRPAIPHLTLALSARGRRGSDWLVRGVTATPAPLDPSAARRAPAWRTDRRSASFAGVVGVCEPGVINGLGRA